MFHDLMWSKIFSPDLRDLVSKREGEDYFEDLGVDNRVILQ